MHKQQQKIDILVFGKWLRNVAVEKANKNITDNIDFPERESQQNKNKICTFRNAWKRANSCYVTILQILKSIEATLA